MRVFVLAFMGVVSLAACAPKPSVTVTVTPPEVLLGESAQVSWHVTPGTLHCRLNPDQGLVEPDGVITVTPHTTVDFIIDCGDEIVGDAFLRVRKPTTIIAFSATPTMAVPDQPIHLSW